MQTIPIRVSIKVKNVLNRLKVNRETYDDVLKRLIKFYKEKKNEI